MTTPFCSDTRDAFAAGAAASSTTTAIPAIKIRTPQLSLRAVAAGNRARRKSERQGAGPGSDGVASDEIRQPSSVRSSSTV
ncbi:MAG TPA: hypothetical protein VFT09_12140, partial [Ilumatobacteraceae bacterium]|nr:hypothetical protein [Ilumatobacteraceae bacterium]